MAQTLETLLDSLTVEGDLYEKLPENAVRCYACGHRCYIREGRRGVCKVRFNDGGRLRVPWGYVGALQCDPTEKKPFFHIYPGSETLTFGMLGCDLHCSYCFPPETMVVTDQGVLPLGQVFALGQRKILTTDGEASAPAGLRAVTAEGRWRNVVQVFRHPYTGGLMVIKPYYLPTLRCTPDHRVYAASDPGERPHPLRAEHLTTAHYLAIPRRFEFSSPQYVDVRQMLHGHAASFETPHYKTTRDIVEQVMIASAQGVTSRAIGAQLGRDPSYIRHVRSKVRRGLWVERKSVELLIENGKARFSNEHQPGLPLVVALDEPLARLLGYYCAEGSVQKDKTRPNSYSLVFTFGLQESDKAEDTIRLLGTCFGVKAALTRRRTTLAVSISKSSLALVFMALCGNRAAGKCVPRQLFDAPRPVVQAFVDAYVAGDGHKYPNGKITATTTSRQLAYGVAWLSLKLGNLPSLYENRLPPEKVIEGRRVKQSPVQYTVVWYEDSAVERKCVITDDFYLVPLRSVTSEDYNGDVFNLEVEHEHNYLANFALVANCQNWVTSQALRDPASEHSGAYPERVTPQQLVQYGRRNGARLVGSSYNEPLITSEWARAVFREAVAGGLQCVYISNGNVTREVLEYIRPHMIGYKIDLKCMNDKRYRQLGAVLNNVLDGIKLVHEAGLWLEVVTLVIPGFNDSNDELMDAARYIAALSPDIPWHVTAFHPDYKMTEPDRTTAQTLLRAAEIGQEAGLNFVYAGNLPGQVGDYENTYCPNCRRLLIGRLGYVITDYRLTDDGHCPDCGAAVPGIWPKRSEVRLGTAADLYRRVPRRVR